MKHALSWAGVSRGVAALLMTLLLGACERPPGRAAAPAETAEAAAMPVEPAAEPASSLAAAQPRLPISLNTLMVALVNHAADPIWVAAWRNPESEQDWRNLQRLAVQLEVAGALLVIPGTGPRDEEWAADPDWQAWSGRLQQAGARAVAAVGARDLAAISTVGDEVVEICEGCHVDFKPALPTGGEFGELSPTAADFQEERPR